MSPVSIHSPTKINLTLDVLGRDERSGKHFVNTILYRDDSFFDEIELGQTGGRGVVLTCDSPEVPTNEENTILKAMKLLGESGWEITLRKKIPIQAGLGGGSSNAGSILKFFGKQKGIPEHELLELAKRIGADVPFFILDDNLAYFEGFGDEYVQSWKIEPLKIDYLNTGIKVSTEEAYTNLNLDHCAKNSVKTERLLGILNSSTNYKPSTINQFFHNDFEDSFFHQYPELQGKGHLTGSGGFLYFSLVLD